MTHPACQSLSILGAFFLGGTSLCAQQETPSTPAEWTIFRGNPAMTGVIDADFPPGKLELAWTFETKKRGTGKVPPPIVATPVVKDGRLYVGNGDGFFHCLELATGKEVWQHNTDDVIEGSAVLIGDLVVFGCGDSFVYALDRATGEERWKFETYGEVLGSANAFTDEESGKDRVVIGSYDASAYCLDAETGKKLWDYETGNQVNGGVGVAGGRAMFGGCDGFIYVVKTRNGVLERKVEVASYIPNTVVVDKGIAYVGHYGNKVEAYDLESGDQVWEFLDRDFAYFSSPALTPTHLFIGGRDKRMHCIDRVTGKQSWEFRARDRIDSSPLVCGGKTVYFGDDDGFLYAVDAGSGKEMWEYEIGSGIRSSPVIVGDTLLIAADDGVVYAFRSK